MHCDPCIPPISWIFLTKSPNIRLTNDENPRTLFDEFSLLYHYSPSILSKVKTAIESSTSVTWLTCIRLRSSKRNHNFLTNSFSISNTSKFSLNPIVKLWRLSSRSEVYPNISLSVTQQPFHCRRSHLIFTSLSTYATVSHYSNVHSLTMCVWHACRPHLRVKVSLKCSLVLANIIALNPSCIICINKCDFIFNWLRFSYISYAFICVIGIINLFGTSIWSFI